mgnify:CR=1 FL=1|jgi:hypothetical protein
MVDFNKTAHSDSTASNSHPTKLLLILAVFFLGQALQYSNGFLSAAGIFFLTISLTLIILSVTAKKSPEKAFITDRIHILIILGFIWQVFQLLTQPPGIARLEDKLDQLWIFQLLIILSGFFALTSLIPLKQISQRIQRFAVFLTFITFLGAGIWIIKAYPNPQIDVFRFQQTSSKALLQGKNPYEQPIPNIYGPGTSLYGEKLIEGDHLNVSNPYPPLSIYVSTLGYIVGKDIRYSHLAAILLVAILIIIINPNRDSLLISYLFLFTPRVFFVLEQSWTEPIVLLFTIIAIWSALKKSKWLPYALGLMIASKQYYVFIIPFLYFLIPTKTNWRKWIKPSATLIATGLIVTAFLALWNIPAFLWNVGIFQWYQPFRVDSLSFATLYVLFFQQYPPGYLSFAALFIAFLFAKHYLTPSAENFALAISLGLGIFFAFNKQAFCNYYYLFLGSLAVAAAVLPAFSSTDNSAPPTAQST